MAEQAHLSAVYMQEKVEILLGRASSLQNALTNMLRHLEVCVDKQELNEAERSLLHVSVLPGRLSSFKQQCTSILESKLDENQLHQQLQTIMPSSLLPPIQHILHECRQIVNETKDEILSADKAFWKRIKEEYQDLQIPIEQFVLDSNDFLSRGDSPSFSSQFPPSSHVPPSPFSLMLSPGAVASSAGLAARPATPTSNTKLSKQLQSNQTTQNIQPTMQSNMSTSSNNTMSPSHVNPAPFPSISEMHDRLEQLQRTLPPNMQIDHIINAIQDVKHSPVFHSFDSLSSEHASLALHLQHLKDQRTRLQQQLQTQPPVNISWATLENEVASLHSRYLIATNPEESARFDSAVDKMCELINKMEQKAADMQLKYQKRDKELDILLEGYRSSHSDVVDVGVVPSVSPLVGSGASFSLRADLPPVAFNQHGQIVLANQYTKNKKLRERHTQSHQAAPSTHPSLLNYCEQSITLFRRRVLHRYNKFHDRVQQLLLSNRRMCDKFDSCMLVIEHARDCLERRVWSNERERRLMEHELMLSVQRAQHVQHHLQQQREHIRTAHNQAIIIWQQLGQDIQHVIHKQHGDQHTNDYQQ